MTVKRLTTETEKLKIGNRSKLIKKLKIESDKTTPDITKCVRWIYKILKGEADV